MILVLDPIKSRYAGGIFVAGVEAEESPGGLRFAGQGQSAPV
jgi:hypothetical protein